MALPELLQAARSGDADAFERVLGEDVDGAETVRDAMGWTALHYAVHEGHAGVARLAFLRAPALLNVGCKHLRRTPLHVACENGEWNMVTLLVREAGAQLDGRDCNGDTPLHYAARNGHASVVTFLCSQGADHEARNRFGHTPLDLAARSARANAYTVEFLRSVKRAREVFFCLARSPSPSPASTPCWIVQLPSDLLRMLREFLAA